MSRFGRLLGLIVAVGGFAAAYAVVPPGNAMELPPTPTVTVSVPTLPVPAPVPAPTVPVPVQPPPLPAPPPVTPPAVPTAPVTTSQVAGAPPGAPRVPLSTAVSPPAPTALSPTQSSIAGTRSSGESRAARPSTTKRSQRLQARPHRGRNRVSVRLEFMLPKAERVFLIVRGPAPSCRVAGVIPVRGRKGANTVDFAGRVRGRPLKPGVYLLTVSPTRRPTADAPTEYVRVVSKRRTFPLADSARKPSCSEAQALAADPTALILLGEGRPAGATTAARPAAPLRPPLQGSGADDEDESVAGFVPDPRSLGASAGHADLEAFATIAVLTIFGALAMLALVARFLRGN